MEARRWHGICWPRRAHTRYTTCRKWDSYSIAFCLTFLFFARRQDFEVCYLEKTHRTIYASQLLLFRSSISRGGRGMRAQYFYVVLGATSLTTAKFSISKGRSLALTLFSGCSERAAK